VCVCVECVGMGGCVCCGYSVCVCVCVVGIGVCEECGYVGVGRVCMLYVIHVCTYVCCV